MDNKDQTLTQTATTVSPVTTPKKFYISKRIALALGGLVILILITGVFAWQQKGIFEPKASCTDSDQQPGTEALYESGIVTIKNPGFPKRTYVDRCDSEIRLREFGCRYQSNTEKYYDAQTLHDCEYGCSRGRCLTADESIITPTPIITLQPTPTTVPTPTPQLVAYPPVSEWQTLSQRDNFWLMAPGSCELISEQGVDSLVGSLTCPDFRLSYDYGRYSNDLSDEESDVTKYETSYLTISNTTAKIITPRDYPGQIGIYFESVSNQTESKLTLYGTTLSSTQQQVILDIFNSISFAQ